MNNLKNKKTKLEEKNKNLSSALRKNLLRRKKVQQIQKEKTNG
jgi:hypothetical protein